MAILVVELGGLPPVLPDRFAVAVAACAAGTFLKHHLLRVHLASWPSCLDIDFWPRSRPEAGLRSQRPDHPPVLRAVRPLLPQLYTTRASRGVAGWGLVHTHAADAARVLPRPALPRRSALRFSQPMLRHTRGCSALALLARLRACHFVRRASPPTRQATCIPEPRRLGGLLNNVHSDSGGANSLLAAALVPARSHRKAGLARGQRGVGLMTVVRAGREAVSVAPVV